MNNLTSGCIGYKIFRCKFVQRNVMTAPPSIFVASDLCFLFKTLSFLHLWTLAQVFRCVLLCQDTSGSVWTRSDAFGFVPMRSDACGHLGSFPNFWHFFVILKHFQMFSEMFEWSWTCLDIFTCVWIHSDALGCIRIHFYIFQLRIYDPDFVLLESSFA